jgi:O-succinylbenzoate synthase
VLSTSIGDVAVVRLRLHVPFRGITSREVALTHGPAGWGEFAPFVEYDDATAVPWYRAMIEAARRPAPAAIRSEVPVNATVPAVPADQVAGVLARFPGCTTAKVKVADPGQSLSDDLDRIAAVRDALGPAGAIRIDANAAWDAEQAIRVLPEYDRVAGGLEYVEQPTGSDGLSAVRRAVDVPIAADESIRRSDDPTAIAADVDIAVVKVAPLGGVRAALDVAERLERPVVVSSAVDSSVGLAAGVAVAAALPELPYACGLGTAALLADDVTDDPLVPHDGVVDVRAVDVSPDALTRLAVEPDREQWWFRRLERVAEAAR